VRHLISLIEELNRRGEKEDNNCQSIWDKSEVLWRTCLGTDWELESNIVRTHLEPERKMKSEVLLGAFWGNN